MRHYFLGRCSALVVCARRWRPVWGAWAGAGFCVFPVSPFPPCVSCAVFGGPSRPGVPYPRSLVRHSMRSVRSSGSVQLPFWSSPGALCVCVRPRSRGVSAPSPIPGLVWRAHLERSQCWALVGPFHAVCAPPRVLPRSHAPFGLLGGGGGVPFPSTWLGAARSRWGGCWCGDPSPNPPRALLRAGFARYGGGTRVPGGGASCLGVGRPGSGAVTSPTTRPFRRAAGAHYPLAVGAGAAGVGTRHQPQRARSGELALRAVRAGRGCPGGGTVRLGVRGWALSRPRPLVLSGVRPGPTTHCLWVRGMRAWGPVTNPSARTLASWLCAPWERHKGARGGPRFAWASGVAHSPTPDRPSPGVCGRGGGRLFLGCGASGVGRSPTPDH